MTPVSTVRSARRSKTANQPQTQPSSPSFKSFLALNRQRLGLSLLLFAAVLAFYSSITANDFIGYDDPGYILDNAPVKAGLTWDTVKWAFTNPDYASNYHPLTWLSHALDCDLFGLNPVGPHWENVVLHGFTAVLLFWLLESATGFRWRSLMVAALFALHPINVESVAWAAERKNVLSTFCFLAAIGAYGWYAMGPNWKKYLAMAGLFICGLASKPMVVTLPFALLLLDYWPLQRLKIREPEEKYLAGDVRPLSFLAAILEKLPLVFLSGLVSVITFFAQKSAGATRQLSLSVRVENAIVAYATYLQKLIWPSHLTPVYPHPGDTLSALHIALSGAVLLAITAWALFSSHKYLIVGWLWFLGTLLPTIGLIQVGDQAMADRFAYIPELGIFVMVVWAAADFLDARKIRVSWRMIPATLALLTLAALTHRQITYWHSSYDLWSHAIQVTQNNFIAEDNLGGALLLMGKEEEAYPHFVAAAKINPRDPLSRGNLGTYALSHGDMQKALTEYQAAIALTSDTGLLAQTYANLGAAQRALGYDTQARDSFGEALRLNPNQYNAWLGLGLLAQKQGKLQEAIFDLSHSVELQPNAQGYFQLGNALEQAGRPAEALSAFEEALRISPDMTEAQHAADDLRKAP